jgi:hypothetical protein
VQLEELGKLKNSFTSSGLEPATFRPVPQPLRYSVPQPTVAIQFNCPYQSTAMLNLSKFHSVGMSIDVASSQII